MLENFVNEEKILMRLEQRVNGRRDYSPFSFNGGVSNE